MRRDGWDTAFDAQNDLREALTHRPVAKGAVREVIESVIHVKDRLAEKTETAAEVMEEAHTLVRATEHMIEVCDPIWVNGEVLDLVDAAVDGWRIKPVRFDDIIIPGGFAYFERPLTIEQHDAKELLYRAVSWGVAGLSRTPQGVFYALWSHIDDEDSFWPGELTEVGFGKAELRAQIGNMMLSHVGIIPFDTEQSAWTVPLGARDVAHLQVLWQLMKQEIVLPGRQQVSRPTWRRKSNWRQIKHVTVLTLRRAKTHRVGEPGDVEVPWSHRWLVHGHWRTQPYKNPDGSTRYEQIWIAPYIKGPDDKPFVPKVRAVEFIR